MDLSPYINQLREDLTASASAGDDQTRQVAAVLSGSLESATRLALMNALSDLAAEVTTQLDGQVVDVRLDGRDIRAVVSGSSREAQAPATSQPEPAGTPGFGPTGESGDISRITLRLLDEIKGQAEQAASTQGVSLNTWVAQAVQNALHSGHPHGPWEHRHRHHGTWGGGRVRWRGDAPGSGGEHVRGWVQG